MTIGVGPLRGGRFRRGAFAGASLVGAIALQGCFTVMVNSPPSTSSAPEPSVVQESFGPSERPTPEPTLTEGDVMLDIYDLMDGSVTLTELLAVDPGVMDELRSIAELHRTGAADEAQLRLSVAILLGRLPGD